MKYKSWNEAVKLLLKAELVKRGISNEMLAELLNRKYNMEETAQSIGIKIYRGTFSANFFLQSLTVIKCRSMDVEVNIVKAGKK